MRRNEMAYKRPVIKKEIKLHNLRREFGIYGFIDISNDQPWISPHLIELHDDARYALSQFSSAIKAVNEMEVSHLKPEAAKKLKTEMVLNAKRVLMSFLKKHRMKYEDEVVKVEQMILRQTQPDSPSDPIKALQQDMKLREIRDRLRQIPPQERRDAVAGSLERIQAVVSNPDPGDLIIDANALIEIRREFAFKQDPSLVQQEKDQREILKAVRKRAGDISATSAKMLIYYKMEDPLPPSEFFDVFNPQTAHEQAYADQRIQRWERRQAEDEKKIKFEEENEGVNIEAGERAERLKQGIRH